MHRVGEGQWHALGVASALGLALWVTAALAIADSKEGLAAATEPSSGAPEAIGDYSAGCVQGASALPLDGAGYQVMHPSRKRYFGHPALVGFLQTLGTQMAAAGHVFLIGDLSQPRGGRASGGHASHQSGLDVDIWFWHPKAAKERALTEKEREDTKARSVLDGKNGVVRKQWAAQVRAMLHFAADDARVERLFVHPIIKRELCANEDADPAKRAWLRKVRPWYGHDDHVHVRLACPEGTRIRRSGSASAF
jgi:penicillin-insensitive murein endopeptidase